jgi:hypothetical protein
MLSTVHRRFEEGVLLRPRSCLREDTFEREQLSFDNTHNQNLSKFYLFDFVRGDCVLARTIEYTYVV